MKKRTMLFARLPSDLLPQLLSYLHSTELRSLDTAILNHNDRPVFLAALLVRFQRDSSLSFWFSIPHSDVHWYACRRIPIATLDCFRIDIPPEVISRYRHSLKEISCSTSKLSLESLAALGECSQLERLEICYDCTLPSGFEIGSILINLTNLTSLKLRKVPFSRTTIEMISRGCQSLQSLELSFISYVGDDELSCLVAGCPSLHSLKLYSVDITDSSVRMLLSMRHRIKSIGIGDCAAVSWDSMSLLLREITIPQIFESVESESEVRVSAVDHLFSAIPSARDPDPRIIAFLSAGLMSQLVDLLSLTSDEQLRVVLLMSFPNLHDDYLSLVVDAGLVPVVVRLTHQLGEDIFLPFHLLFSLSRMSHLQRRLLSCGVLSIFRTFPPKVTQTIPYLPH